MMVKLEIGYEQLLQLFRQLSPKQKKQFLQDAQKEISITESSILLQEPETDYPRMDMQSAATLLLNDYQHDEDLTVFTELDTESYHETR